MVGAPRFELGTSWSRTKRATRLRYAPTRAMVSAGDQFQAQALDSAPLQFSWLFTGHLPLATASMVGTARFELATPCTPSKCATRLRYVPRTKLHFTAYKLPKKTSSLGPDSRISRDLLRRCRDPPRLRWTSANMTSARGRASPQQRYPAPGLQPTLSSTVPECLAVHAGQSVVPLRRRSSRFETTASASPRAGQRPHLQASFAHLRS